MNWNINADLKKFMLNRGVARGYRFLSFEHLPTLVGTWVSAIDRELLNLSVQISRQHDDVVTQICQTDASLFAIPYEVAPAVDLVESLRVYQAQVRKNLRPAVLYMSVYRDGMFSFDSEASWAPPLHQPGRQKPRKAGSLIEGYAGPDCANTDTFH